MQLDQELFLWRLVLLLKSIDFIQIHYPETLQNERKALMTPEILLLSTQRLEPQPKA